MRRLKHVGFVRSAVLGLAALTACASHGPAPTLPAPLAGPGEVRVVAEARERVGDVLPIAVAVTSAYPGTLQLDVRQVYAHEGADTGPRFPSMPPTEAARLAGGRRLPGAVRGAAGSVVGGAALGSLGGAISGAIQGGIGGAVAAGAAVGAALGLITGGVMGWHEPPPDVAGFTDRALQDTALRSGFSATGYVYFAPGTYRTLEVVLASESGEAVLTRIVAIDPAP
jgi:hypothetical protein